MRCVVWIIILGYAHGLRTSQVFNCYLLLIQNDLYVILICYHLPLDFGALVLSSIFRTYFLIMSSLHFVLCWCSLSPRPICPSVLTKLVWSSLSTTRDLNLVSQALRNTPQSISSSAQPYLWIVVRPFFPCFITTIKY